MSALQAETRALKEALQREELEKLKREQIVQELTRKVASMEANQQFLDAALSEKKQEEVENERRFKHLQQKAHKLSKKVYVITSIARSTHG